MTIEKLRKRKDENIISGVEKKMRVSFFFLVTTLIFLSLFFYLIENPIPHTPTSPFVSYKNMSPFRSKQSIFK
jgi:hypothetical protein